MVRDGGEIVGKGVDFVAPVTGHERPIDLSNREPTAELVATPVETIETKTQSKEILHFEKLPKEQQLKLINQMLEGMRESIGPVKEHVVFASTAMFLNGEELVKSGDERGRELLEPPGDFDAAVFKAEDLDAIRDRLRARPDVIFANAKKDLDGKIMRDAMGEVAYNGEPGKYGKFPGQETKILAGQQVFDVEINGKSEKVAYEFEVFLDTYIVPHEAATDLAIESHGLRVLNLEGLTDQYQKNLDFELKVNDAVVKKIAELKQDSPEMKNFRAEILSIDTEGDEPRKEVGEEDLENADKVALTEETTKLLQHFEAGPREMKRVFEIQDEIDEIEKEYKTPLAKLNMEGVFTEYVNAVIESGNDTKADKLKMAYEDIQKLVSERASLLAETKTKLWKRDLNLLQLAQLRGTKT